MEQFSDLYYLKLSMIHLKELEKIVHMRHERLRIFLNKIRGIRIITAGILVSLISLLIWWCLLILKINRIYIETSSVLVSSITSLVIKTVLVFGISYLFIRLSWQQSFFRTFSRLFEKKVIAKLQDEVENIDTLALNILSHSVFQKPRLPEKYLTCGYLSLLLDYLKKNPATTLDEALEILIFEHEYKEDFFDFGACQTALQKELAYLSNRKKSLLNKIKQIDTSYFYTF